eukprot:TRINITY_DN2608_c0_g1_i1.p1 TRINITY_DN2608_c0_g1~~TRINITY_DN2608_c0_g1_i1.p1  ORF type:complete len:427 (-),score=112.42 TRINITY_DN2608_c0_g1_i1:67-1347(-)
MMFPKGVIPLHDASLRVEVEHTRYDREFCFELQTKKGRVFPLVAEDFTSFEKWTAIIDTAIRSADLDDLSDLEEGDDDDQTGQLKSTDPPISPALSGLKIEDMPTPDAGRRIKAEKELSSEEVTVMIEDVQKRITQLQTGIHKATLEKDVLFTRLPQLYDLAVSDKVRNLQEELNVEKKSNSEVIHKIMSERDDAVSNARTARRDLEVLKAGYKKKFTMELKGLRDEVYSLKSAKQRQKSAEAVRRGAVMTCIHKNGKHEDVFVQLTEEKEGPKIGFGDIKKRKMSHQALLRDVEAVHYALHSPSHIIGKMEPEDMELCFTITCSKDKDNMDFKCSSPQLLQTWVIGIQSVLYETGAYHRMKYHLTPGRLLWIRAAVRLEAQARKKGVVRRLLIYRAWKEAKDWTLQHSSLSTGASKPEEFSHLVQ